MKEATVIRPMQPAEYPLLEDFLYEAIFLPEGTQPPPRDIVLLPELQLYIADFGTKKADFAMVAEVNGKIVGAAWSRIVKDYGHVDEQTPSLSVSLYAPYRRQGIGTRLFRQLLDNLSDKGYEKASLSVQKANYAAQMYLKMGFHIVKENEYDYVMVIHLKNNNL
ncbi:GNAT family N-acetyltransferase [Capnocytophaga sp.]|uniref:GNAT family N-acetyltransferase n=1 Tax=Capnocytophaga sp. TaxID=44737 RepID=UPI0026DC544F|nr:GNAT family N-acetyltransferase [Capnocytophaga sp.]MDO5104994.1 GNAT family N-acetyltransferase [Capnocytophaga sp.]